MSDQDATNNAATSSSSSSSSSNSAVTKNDNNHGKKGTKDDGLFVCGKVVQVGDCVVLYGGHQSLCTAKVEKTGFLNHQLGEIHFEDIAGKEYGSQVAPRKANKLQKKRKRRKDRKNVLQCGGFLTILPVTPELWSKAVQTRTAVTTVLEDSLIVSHLQLLPGQVVVESGTGSGCLTMYLAQAVGPKGHVHTFEFNEERVKAAKSDFDKNGFSPYITCEHRDVYSDGFGDALMDQADAVFLDLPNPWLAIPHALKVLKPFGRICTFSPCIEQVQQTVELLSKEGFSHILTMECLFREFRSTRYKRTTPAILMKPDGNKKQKVDAEKEQDDDEEERGGKESTNDQDDEDANNGNNEDEEDNNDDDNEEGEGNDEETGKRSKGPQKGDTKDEMETILQAMPFERMKGHNGYLTFAYGPLEKKK